MSATYKDVEKHLLHITNKADSGVSPGTEAWIPYHAISAILERRKDASRDAGCRSKYNYTTCFFVEGNPEALPVPGRAKGAVALFLAWSLAQKDEVEAEDRVVAEVGRMLDEAPVPTKGRQLYDPESRETYEPDRRTEY